MVAGAPMTAERGRPPQVPGDGAAGPNAGRAFLFARNQGGPDNWDEIARFVGSNVDGGDKFGESVAIDGDSIVVGARADSQNGSAAGSAYVFTMCADCNGNGVPDADDIAGGGSADANRNGIPDECEVPPPNDDCAAAETVAECLTPFTTIWATTDGPPTVCDGGAGDEFVSDIWFVYTASCSGTARFSTCNAADFDVRLAVYEAGSCPPAVLLACSYDAAGCGQTAQLELPVTSGTQYLVRIGGTSGGGTGTLQIGCEPAPCPPDLNDDLVVSAKDLLILLALWGTDPGGPPDFDDDGNVGTADLLILLSAWGPCSE